MENLIIDHQIKTLKSSINRIDGKEVKVQIKKSPCKRRISEIKTRLLQVSLGLEVSIPHHLQ